MKVAVITFPGSNCDYDCYKLLQGLPGVEPYFLWHRDSTLADADAVILPGGFSYGDYLRPGAIARMSPIMAAVEKFAAAGGPVLGICNGFQILCEAGLLPGALLRNRTMRFASRPIILRVENRETLFTSSYEPGQLLRMPVAHGDGKYYADDATLDRLETEGSVVFRYVDRDGRASDAANPNGAARNIAGIINDAGNVLGMMPHPERAADTVLGSTDGLALFASLIRHLREAAVA